MKNTVLLLLFIVSSGTALSGFAQESRESIAFTDSVNNFSFGYIISNTDKCIELYKKSIEKSKKNGYESGLGKSLSLLSLSYYYAGKYDSSFYYSLKSIDVYEKNGDTDAAGNEYAELGYRYKRINLDKAFFYMKKGIALIGINGDTEKLISAYNNLGYLYEMNNQIDSAEILYEKSLALSEKINNLTDISYALMSIAGINIIKENFNEAEKILNKAKEIREKINDKTGLAETYAAFGDLFFKKNEPEKAVFWYKKSIKLADTVGYPYFKQYNFEKLFKLYEKTGNYGEALKYHKLYTAVKDSILNENTLNKINELEIKFRTEKKEKEIALQKIKIKEKELKVRRRTYLLYLISSLTIFVLSIFYLVYKKQKFKQKKLIEENRLKEQIAKIRIKNRLQNERLRISGDLHDNLGSYLTFIISSIENILFFPDIKKEVLTEKLTDINEFAKTAISEFRDTVWSLNKPDVFIDEFVVRVIKFCEKAAGANEKISFKVKNKITREYKLSSEESINLFRCIKESVNNAVKHSKTDRIDIIFEEETDIFKIKIKDYGTGIPENNIKYGNGLKNMKNRTEKIGGKFEIHVNNGTETVFTLNKKNNTSNDVSD